MASTNPFDSEIQKPAAPQDTSHLPPPIHPCCSKTVKIAACFFGFAALVIFVTAILTHFPHAAPTFYAVGSAIGFMSIVAIALKLFVTCNKIEVKPRPREPVSEFGPSQGPAYPR